jgi:hypothetical protein
MSTVRGPEWPLVACVAAAGILALPLWCVATPAMPDYPAHLASFYLIAGGSSHYYQIVWSFLPNLAAETIVPVVARLIPLEMATRLFITATVALWVLGPAAIQRALFGRVNVAALFATFFAYNANFMWGFLNYTFAAGLSFLVFAAWIATDRRRTIPHQIGFAAAFTLIYFCHLFALAILLLAVGSFELAGWIADKPRSLRKLLLRAAPAAIFSLPAAAAFLVLKPHGAAIGNLEFNLFDTMSDRFEAAIQYGFDKPATILTGAVVLLFVAGLVLRPRALHPRMRIALPLFVLATVLMPEWALGGWGVHMRLPAVLGALAFASVEWKMPRRAAFAAGGIALAVVSSGAVALTGQWGIYSAQFEEFRAHAADVKPGGKLLPVLAGASIGWAPDQPYWHMAEFAVIDRGVFTPLMFATAGQHVIHIIPPLGKIAARTAEQGSPPDIDELDELAAGRIEADDDIRDVLPYLTFFQCHFDQAVVIHGAGPLSRIPTMLHLRHRGSFYALYDIVPDARCVKR